MALFKENTLIAPSADVRTQQELDSTTIEAGLYYCLNTITISAGAVSIQADKWSVICISSETKTTLHCYAQLWIPSDNTSNPTIFIRYSSGGSTWGGWHVLMSNMLGVQNGTAGDVRLVISNTQPSAISGVTQVWIDTSS